MFMILGSSLQRASLGSNLDLTRLFDKHLSMREVAVRSHLSAARRHFSNSATCAVKLFVTTCRVAGQFTPSGTRKYASCLGLRGHLICQRHYRISRFTGKGNRRISTVSCARPHSHTRLCAVRSFKCRKMRIDDRCPCILYYFILPCACKD